MKCPSLNLWGSGLNIFNNYLQCKQKVEIRSNLKASLSEKNMIMKIHYLTETMQIIQFLRTYFILHTFKLLQLIIVNLLLSRKCMKKNKKKCFNIFLNNILRFLFFLFFLIFKRCFVKENIYVEKKNSLLKIILNLIIL